MSEKINFGIFREKNGSHKTPHRQNLLFEIRFKRTVGYKGICKCFPGDLELLLFQGGRIARFWLKGVRVAKILTAKLPKTAPNFFLKIE